MFIVVIALWLLNTTRVSIGRADGSDHFLKEIAVGGESGWDYFKCHRIV
jgi:hypothetical protein